ncbi:MAG: Smr/MutS family protein [Thermodesulfovibrionales bacterium]|jgi:DNA-nicking Smr family endonuclease
MKPKKPALPCASHLSPPALHYPFENLKELMARKGFSPVRKTVKEEKAPDAVPDDDELFARAMRDVREIPEFRMLPIRHKKPKPEYKREPGGEAVAALDDICKGRRPMDLSNTQEYMEWVNPDCGPADAQALHEGRFSVQDFLDLHGYSLEEAEAEVNMFLKGALMRGLRCIKIIHGRGLRSPRGPVLKDAIRQWLTGRYRKHIIAFVSARQCDGGLGAVFVLLKRG